VLDFGHGLAVHRLMSGVAYSSQIVAGSSVGGLNSLEFSIMEVSSMLEISLLGRALVDLQSAEVVLRESLSVGGSELVLSGRSDSLVEFAVNSSSGSLSKALGVDVLGLNLRYVASITRNVLGLDIVSRSSKPVVSVFGEVAVLKSFVEFISSRCVGVEFTLSERRLTHSNINIVVAGLVTSLGDDLVNVSSSAAVDVILLRDVASVARQVFFGVFDVSHY